MLKIWNMQIGLVHLRCRLTMYILLKIIVSMSLASSQLTHCGLSLVPTCLYQLSSGCAPMPWTATILPGRLA